MRIKLVLMILSLIFYSCNGDSKLEMHLKEIKKINSQIPLDNWEILQNEEDSKEVRYQLRKKEADTVMYLNFRKVFYDSIFNPGPDYYWILYFNKEFCTDSFKYVIQQGIDTNYYYKASVDNPDSLIFIVGKYDYMCRRGEFSGSQMEYFYEHEDSLKSVRGNVLHPLPN